MNAVGEDADNDLATLGIDLPLLQDTAEVDAWGAWDVTWRDVVILDRANLPVAVYNLTEHNLSEPDAYDGLEQLLVDIASQ